MPRNRKRVTEATAFGRSLHVDFYDVPLDLDDLDLFTNMLSETAKHIGMTKQASALVIHSPEKNFPDKAGLSGFLPLIESGISIHTLSLRQFVSIDLYTCGSLDIHATLDFLAERLQSRNFEYQYLVRGTKYNAAMNRLNGPPPMNGNPASPTTLKIVSGGQTGVDRAALDAAIAVGLPTGGWCPKGRLAEDGRIPEAYLLHECSLPGYPVRTRANVVESDGTLIVVRGESYGRGTKLTLRCIDELKKPHLLVDLKADSIPAQVVTWIKEKQISVLNVAGPRESGSPGIQAESESFLKECFRAFSEGHCAS